MTPPEASIPFAGVPSCLEGLAETKRWVGWQWETRTGAVKPTKAPRTVIGGRANGSARSNDPSTWATLAEATAAMQSGQVEGVGLQLLNLSGFAAIDLDDIRDQSGTLRPWAADLIDRSGSYAELTPSGTGARIIGRVEKEHPSLHKSIPHTEGGKVELFVNCSTGRYVTITGARIDFAPEVAADITPIIAELLALEQAAAERKFKIDLGEDRRDLPKAGLEEVAEALTYIDPDLPYSDWLAVLMALHDKFGDAGLRLAVEWSSQGTKYVPGEIEDKWPSFTAGGGASLATVFHHARQGGCDVGALARKHLFGTADRQSHRTPQKAEERGDSDNPQGGERSSESTVAPAFSDEALALEFADRHEHRLRYVAPWSRWYVWTGRRWEQDDTLQAFDLARAVCREAANACNMNSRGRISSAKTVAAVATLARSDRRLSASVDQWDNDAWLLNTPGGVADLRTGGLRPSRPEDFMTKITSVAPYGDCSLWQGFLSRVTGGDLELQAYLQRLAGYALTGSTREHVLPFAHGFGGNGKGVFIGAIAGAMGDYHKTAPIETFAASNGDRHPTELAMLRGARFVTAQETEEGRRWAEAKIKTLTGGDRISAHFMRQDYFEYQPQFTLLIAGNNKPGLRSVDEAIRRRFHLIPFTVTIPAEERDETLPEKLRAEWPGILAWAIEGCLEWQRAGLRPPAAVLAATEAYLDGQDALGAWLDECTERNANEWTPRTELFTNWQAWAEQAREFVLPRARFFDALEARALAATIRKGTRGFQGIALKQIDYSDAHWNR